MATTQTFDLLGDPAQYYQLIQQGITVDPPVDLQAPLSYKDWLSYNPSVLPARKTTQYNEYLQSWYQSYYQTLDTSQRIYQDYTDLVNSLIKVFGNASDIKRISSLDLTDNFQLNVAIPQLSHKLKEIAVYYIQKRSDVKTSKVRYNMIGSTGGIQTIVYNNLLKAFAKGPQTITLDDATWTHLPQLSSTAASFSIEVQELYDENVYFDKSPDVDYQWPDTNDNWIYSTGLHSLTTTNPLVFSLANYIENAGVLFADQLPASCFDVGDSTGTLNIYNESELCSRFIGTEQYFATGGYSTPKTTSFTIDIQKGTNIFYWPYGEFYLESPNLLEYEPIALVDTNFIEDGATAGTTIDTADIIWVTDGNTLSGAWLKDFSDTRISATMMAELKQGKTTTFKFPYPGYGAVSDRQEWTGKQVTNFTDQQAKTDAFRAQQLYWADTSSVSTSDAISIHDTQLIACGAYAHQIYSNSDKMIIRTKTSDGVHDTNPNNVYNEHVDTAWLYRPLYTQLPITKGETLIYWPYFVDGDAESPAFEISNYFADTIMLSSTDSTISFRGAVAGTTPDTADVIEMLDCGKVVMRAWLSACNVRYGVPTDINNWVDGAIQPGLNVELKSNQWTRFVYDAPDRNPIAITDIKSFVGYNHEADCPYLQATKKSLIKGRLGIDDAGCDVWQKCTCKALYYSPFGHSGERYDDNYRLSDVLMVDTQYPNTPNVNTWIGRDGLSYLESSDFAWYYLSGNPEPDVGWGKGTWMTGSGDQMQLVPGERYVYLRIATCCDREGPPLIVSHSYCNCGSTVSFQAAECNLCVNPYTFVPQCACDSSVYDYCCKPKWIGMSPVGDGWESTNRDSRMPLIAGQKYRYIHRDSTTMTWTSANGASAVSNSITNNSIDFLITQPLSGWGQDTTTHCASCQGGYPYWASSYSNQNGKGINCYTTNQPHAPSDYLYVTSPAPARVTLNNDTYIEYHRSDNDTFIWLQPVTLTVNNPLKQWCHIEIDAAHIDPIITDMHVSNCHTCRTTITEIAHGACACDSTIADIQLDLGCNAHRIVVSATETPSEIILNGKTLCSDYTTISYCAASAFSVTHVLNNTSDPYVVTDPVTGTLTTPQSPWANLANRHYPTVASFTITDSLSTLQQYGLIHPLSHGTLTFIGRDYRNGIEMQGIELTNIKPIVNPAVWNNSRGLTQTDNNQLVSTSANDAQWCKLSPFNGMYNGGVDPTLHCQTFVPYQTYEQIRGTNNGFQTSLQTVWQDLSAQSPDFHQYHNVEQWNSEQPLISGTMSRWATDLYGNQFMLIKPDNVSYSTILARREQRTGTIWVRTLTDDIMLGSQALSAVYSKYQALSSTLHMQLTAGKVVDMQMFGNTMMIVLSSHILFEKLDYDYDSSTINASDDATVIYAYALGKPTISFSKLSNHEYGGHWYDPEHNKLLVLTSQHDTLSSLPYINIHCLDLQTHRFTHIYPRTTADIAEWAEGDSTLQFNLYVGNNTMMGSPVSTVNKDNNQLICHFLMQNVGTKHHFVTATWQLSPTFDNVDLLSIDVKSSLV